MDIEQTLETQRLRLLRLLAGWFAVVAFASGGPLGLELPRWMRGFLASVLIRAELAAQHLVFVSACLSARSGLAQARPAPLPFVKSRDDDPVPSTAMLLRRMKALRALLENLPRHGLRLLRRRRKRKAARSVVVRVRRSCSALWTLCKWALVHPRIERPPDRHLLLPI